MMATTREAGKRGKQPGLRRLCAWLLALVVPVVPACSTPQSQLTGDPLFGEYGLKTPGPSSPPPASPSKTQTSVAPVPPTPFSSTPAALAAGPLPGALPGARPLAIDPWRSPAAAIVPTSGTTLKPLVQPVPRDNPTALGPAAPPNNNWGPQAPTAEAAVLQQLKLRGVLHHEIHAVQEGIHLRVIVPSGTQAGALRHYEATGRDLSTAAQAILQKLDSAR